MHCLNKFLFILLSSNYLINVDLFFNFRFKLYSTHVFDEIINVIDMSLIMISGFCIISMEKLITNVMILIDRGPRKELRNSSKY